MPFRPDRKRRAGRFLEWKIRLFAVAAVVGLAGIYLDERWLTGTAIVLLGLGMGLRLVADRARPGDDDGGPEEDAGGRTG